MRAYILFGGALCAFLLAFIGMVFVRPRAGADIAAPVIEQSLRGEFGRGVLTTARAARAVIVPGQATRILLGAHSIMDTSVSAFTRGSSRSGAMAFVANARLIGEAQFDVALDSRRWYAVRVGDVLVATTGARFKVRLDLGRPGTTSVAVEEGVVALQSLNRKAGSRPGSVDSTQVYDLLAGNVAWWSDSLPPTVVSSVDVKHYRRNMEPDRYAPASGGASDRR